MSNSLNYLSGITEQFGIPLTSEENTDMLNISGLELPAYVPQTGSVKVLTGADDDYPDNGSLDIFPEETPTEEIAFDGNRICKIWELDLYKKYLIWQSSDGRAEEGLLVYSLDD